MVHLVFLAYSLFTSNLSMLFAASPLDSVSSDIMAGVRKSPSNTGCRRYESHSTQLKM